MEIGQIGGKVDEKGRENPYTSYPVLRYNAEKSNTDTCL